MSRSAITEPIKEISDKLGLALPDDSCDIDARVAVITHISGLPPEKQKELDASIIEHYNKDVEHWDAYQEFLAAPENAAKGETAETVEPEKTETVEPEKTETVEPEKTETAEPEKTETVEPAKDEKKEPAKDEKKEPAKKKEAKPKVKKEKGPRTHKPGTLLHTMVTVIRDEPPSKRPALVTKVIEKHAPDASEEEQKKLRTTIQSYFSMSMKEDLAKKTGILLKYEGDEKLVVIVSDPYPAAPNPAAA